MRNRSFIVKGFTDSFLKNISFTVDDDDDDDDDDIDDDDDDESIFLKRLPLARDISHTGLLDVFWGLTTAAATDETGPAKR